MIKFIKTLFRLLWRGLNFVRLLIINLFLLFTVIVVLIAISQVDPSEELQIVSGPLRINLNGILVEEKKQVNPLAEMGDELMGRASVREIDLHWLSYAIRQAADDEMITGLILELDDMPNTSIAKLQSLGNALAYFRQSDKPLIANGNFYDQHQYYLASYASELNLHPSGGVFLRGFNYHRLFYKDAIDKLEVKTQVFRVGTHKSFVEPYIRNDMSAEAKQDVEHWLGQLWDTFITDIAANRQLAAEHLSPSADEVLNRMQQVSGDPAEYALRFGLVDQLMNQVQQQQRLVELFGEDDSTEGYPHTNFSDYAAHIDSPYQSSTRNIALVIAQGAIVGGSGDETMIAADTLINKLDQVLNDDSIEALVLRVDSPGGSAFAAELIRNKLQQIQSMGKPVIISMGSTAASGGYWIAADADYIFAKPTTITGSIGVFGMFANIEQALAKLGIHGDGVSTSPLAELSPMQALPPQVEAIIQLSVEHTYSQFLSIVAQGRGLTLSETEPLAEGKIWTGSDALSLGLVDQLGDTDDALAYAAEKLGLEEYGVIRIRTQLSPREQLLAQLFSVEWEQSLLTQFPWMKPLHKQLPLIERFNDPQGYYSYCALCESI